MARMKLGDKIVAVLTVKQLADKCERTTAYIHKMEQRGILPASNLRGPDRKFKDGSTGPGDRLYTEELSESIAEVVKGFSAGKAVTEKQKQELRNAFMAERIKYNV